MIFQSSDASASERIWDVCLIGSGALGIAMALSLSRGGKSVAVIEAGESQIGDKSQSFYQCRSTGHPHIGASEGRFRVFGGSTERWGGQAMRFDPIDFAPRPGIFPEGWPFAHSELLPYYEEAERFMGVSGADYTAFHTEFRNEMELVGAHGPKLDEALMPFQLHSSVFTTEPRLREKYRSELANLPNLGLFLKSPARRLVADDSGNITALETGETGTARTIRAKTFVLACGGIENARFLLLQRDFHRLPVLSGLPVLGRFMQDHPGCHLGEVRFHRGAVLQDLFRLKQRQNISYKARISWNGGKREAESLLAVSGTLLMMRKPSAFDTQPHSALHQAKGVFAPRTWREMIKLACRGKIFSPLHYTYLAVSAEDLRNRDSRITLSESAVDPLGDPLPEIDWRVSPRVVESIQEYMRCFEQLMTSCSLGTLRWFPFTSDPSLLLEKLQDNSHHIGATSIGSDSSVGVVDKDLRLFGTKNFHVAGTSVLPTGSHANPTLTAIALGLRLAKQLGGGE